MRCSILVREAVPDRYCRFCKRLPSQTGQEQACSRITWLVGRDRAEKGPNTQENGCWLPPGDHIQSETLFETRQDQDRGMNGSASLLHSWHWVLSTLTLQFGLIFLCHHTASWWFLSALLKIRMIFIMNWKAKNLLHTLAWWLKKQWRSKKEVWCLCRQLSKEKITKDQEYTREVETKWKKQTQNWQSEKEQKLKGKEKQILKISWGNLGKRKQKTETKTN